MADRETVLNTLEALHIIEGRSDYAWCGSGQGSASGAYSITDATWRGIGGTTARACQASKDEQNRVAAAYVASILDANGGVPEAVAETWYTGGVGKVPRDRIPHPEAGNKKTVGQYLIDFRVAYNAAEGGTSIFKGGLESLADLPGLAVGAGKYVVDKTAQAVLEGLGALAEPFTQGLRRLVIIGLAVTLGVTLVGLGAWRSVRPASG